MTVFRCSDILRWQVSRRDGGTSAAPGSSSSPPLENGEQMSPEKNASATKVAAGVVGGAAAAVAGSKLVQKVVGEAGKALGADPEQPNRATQTLTVSASAGEVFGFFRDASNFQRVLRNVVTFQPAGERSVHWKVPGPDGHELELDAELTEERPGELLRWTPGADGGTPAELEVRLRQSPAGQGTAVTMSLEVQPGDAAAATPQGAVA